MWTTHVAIRRTALVSLALLAPALGGCVPIVVGQSSRTLTHVEGPLGPSGTPVEVVEKRTKLAVVVLFPPSIWGGEQYVALLDDPSVAGRTRADQVSARAMKFLSSQARRSDEAKSTALARMWHNEMIDDEDGTAHTLVVVSYDPILVVALPTPTGFDGVYEPGQFGGAPEYETGPPRPLLLPSGFLATTRLGPACPVGWFCPTRGIPPTPIAETEDSVIVLDTGREQFTLALEGGHWMARRCD